MEKGIFTREQEKKLASLLDELIKLKGLFEVVDGLVFTAIISLVDDNYINKLPEEIKIKLSEIVEAVLNDDVEKAEQLATELINALVDVPLLDEEMEGLLIGSFIRLIVSAILKWIEGKKEQPVKLKLSPRDGMRFSDYGILHP
jgi:hypothetical protein